MRAGNLFVASMLRTPLNATALVIGAVTTLFLIYHYQWAFHSAGPSHPNQTIEQNTQDIHNTTLGVSIP